MKTNYRFAISTADRAPETAPILLIGSIAENIKKAASLGYDAIEIHLRENSQIDYDNILELCRDCNVKIAAVVTGRLAVQEHVSLTDEQPEQLEKVLYGMKEYIKIAQALKTDIIIGWIRGHISDMQSEQEYGRILGKNLKDIAEYAEQRSVKLFIEGINRYEINSLNNARDILHFINRYSLDNVFVHLDTFHMNIEEVDISKAIILCGDKLGYVHFADSNRRYPGEGHIDFIKVLKALKKIDYKGYFSIECLPLPTHEKAARKAKENLIKMMNRLEE